MYKMRNAHLERQGFVYIRQSTTGQVQNRLESKRRPPGLSVSHHGGDNVSRCACRAIDKAGRTAWRKVWHKAVRKWFSSCLQTAMAPWRRR